MLMVESGVKNRRVLFVLLSVIVLLCVISLIVVNVKN